MSTIAVKQICFRLSVPQAVSANHWRVSLRCIEPLNDVYETSKSMRTSLGRSMHERDTGRRPFSRRTEKPFWSTEHCNYSSTSRCWKLEHAMQRKAMISCALKPTIRMQSQPAARNLQELDWGNHVAVLVLFFSSTILRILISQVRFCQCQCLLIMILSLLTFEFMKQGEILWLEILAFQKHMNESNLDRIWKEQWTLEFGDSLDLIVMEPPFLCSPPWASVLGICVIVLTR